MEKHFQVVQPDGSILLKGEARKPMRINPAAFMVLRTKDNYLYFARDQRQKLLGFFGGAIHIGEETPDVAAVRETKEEGGVSVKRSQLQFVGQFGKLEMVSLFEARTWAGTPYVNQPKEVSEVVKLRMADIQAKPKGYKGEFYPAQWKMLGWYLNQYLISRSPLFEMWENYSVDPWSGMDH
jgi:8-oxo-dGTP pyrophosphatase MutT (NUDIX family)